MKYMQKRKMLVSDIGEELVYINLSYPVFEKGVIKKQANIFYEQLADNYLSFASKALLPAAQKAKGQANFKPFSAVMAYEAKETEEKIIISIRTFVFDGHTRTEGKITYQYWDKKTGIMSIK